MPPQNAPDFVSATRDLPTDEELQHLRDKIQRVGGQRGFPQRKTDRYGAWIMGFVSWCLRTTPYQINLTRLGAFWEALDEHPEAGTPLKAEATDAVGVLFGQLGSVDEVLQQVRSRGDSEASVSSFLDAEDRIGGSDPAAGPPTGPVLQNRSSLEAAASTERR
jgi:hypothetical protein